jgi:hypothetical protein
MDIVGTYSLVGKDYDKKIMLFEYLDQVRELYKQDILLFSFLSSDTMEVINPYLEEVTKIVNSFPNIYLGPQIGNQYAFNPNTEQLIEHCSNPKGMHILNYGKQLSKNYDIEKVIYIDDNPGSHFSFLLLDNILAKLGEKGVEFVVIEPGYQMKEENYPLNIQTIGGSLKKELDYVLEGLDQLVMNIKENEKERS